MRIIAGSLGGRIFDSPRGRATHPMADRARGGLFNTLGDIRGLTVLDAFAGSGALSFEALSRGAATATALELDISAQKVIARNARALNLTHNFKLVSASANGWLTTSSEQLTFDLVLCDPPYNDLQPNLIQRLAARVSSRGILVLSWPGSERALAITGFEVAKQKSYGDAQLIFYTPWSTVSEG